MEVTLLFLGVLVSAVVQLIKKYAGTNTLTTVIATVILALGAAIASQVLSYYGWTEAFMQILTTAGAFYAFIIRNIEKGLEE